MGFGMSIFHSFAQPLLLLIYQLQRIPPAYIKGPQIIFVPFSQRKQTQLLKIQPSALPPPDSTPQVDMSALLKEVAMACEAEVT
jgi:hypothetical protein